MNVVWMHRSPLVVTLVYVAAFLGNAMSPADAAPAQPRESPLAHWYRSLPGLEQTNDGSGIPLMMCRPRPTGYRAKVAIGSDVATFLGRGGMTGSTSARIGAQDVVVDALYDRAHRIGLFYEHGTDINHYLLVANTGAPPVAVKEKDLSALAMGGVVHLGDAVDKVRAALGVGSPLRLTMMSACGFPRAAAYSATLFYGRSSRAPGDAQPCHPPEAAGIVAFRAGRAAILEWDYFACI